MATHVLPMYDPRPALTPPSPSPTRPQPMHPDPHRRVTGPVTCHHHRLLRSTPPCHLPLALSCATLPPPPPSTRCHHRTLHAAGHCSLCPTGRCSLRPTAAPTVYVPLLPHSRHPRLPPFAAMRPTPVPPHFGPHHRVPTRPHARMAPHCLLAFPTLGPHPRHAHVPH